MKYRISSDLKVQRSFHEYMFERTIPVGRCIESKTLNWYEIVGQLQNSLYSQFRGMTFRPGRLDIRFGRLGR